jgi:hypothetical protein
MQYHAPGAASALLGAHSSQRAIDQVVLLVTSLARRAVMLEQAQ